VAQNKNPSFASVAQYEQALVHAYPAASPSTIRRMATHGLTARDDGRFVLKMDPHFRGAAAASTADRDDASQAARLTERHERYREEMWSALERIPCPCLVVRGAGSDIVSPEVADRMADEVLQNGELAVVGHAGHSVMTDNPKGFEEAVSAFVLGE